MSDDELKRTAQASLDPAWPKAGEVWRHYKGGMYDIITIAVHESELVPLVVYRSQSHGTVWARPVGNWLEIVNGSPRFVRS